MLLNIKNSYSVFRLRINSLHNNEIRQTKVVEYLKLCLSSKLNSSYKKDTTNKN